MPVPAGMSLPMITFSLRPSSESDLAEIAASVSTRVVSWNEAADSHDSVASDAPGRALRAVGPLDPRPARRLGDRGDALRDARLEQLADPGQAVRDVLTGNTTGVERPHGQLRAGLTDRLGGDDADRLADV